MSKRDVRIDSTAADIRGAIRLTVKGYGGGRGFELTYEDLALAGWDSLDDAIEAHHDEAFEMWLNYAPETIRQTYKLRGLFEREWSMIRVAAGASEA